MVGVVSVSALAALLRRRHCAWSSQRSKGISVNPGLSPELLDVLIWIAGGRGGCAEKEEDEDELQLDDPHALIGEDTEDEDYWGEDEEEEEGESEEGPPKEIPSV